MYFFMLPIQILLGIISAYIAFKKQRNPFGWFFIGFLFGLIGIVIVLILPPSDIRGNSNQNCFSEEDYTDPTLEISSKEVEETAEKTITSPIFEAPNWFYLDENKKAIGPFNEENLMTILLTKENRKEIWIWKKGMPDWQKTISIPSINNRLN